MDVLDNRKKRTTCTRSADSVRSRSGGSQPRENPRESRREKLNGLLFSTDSSEIRDALRGVLTGVAKNIPINEALAAIMKVLATGKNTQFIIDELVKFGRKWIGENKKSIRESIESAWWRPDFIDDMMCDKIISDILRILSEIEDDKNHRARTEVREFFSSWGDKLTRDRSMAKNLDGMRDEFFRNKAVRSFFPRTLGYHLQEHECRSEKTILRILERSLNPSMRRFISVSYRRSRGC